MELIRYAGSELDPDSGQPEGIFQIIGRVLRAGLLSDADHQLLSRMSRWFSANLAQPRRFSHFRHGNRRTTSGIWVRKPIAISWFKTTARVHVARIETCVHVLRGAGLHIQKFVSLRPGYITFEDQHQVVAVPFTESEQGIKLLRIPPRTSHPS